MAIEGETKKAKFSTVFIWIFAILVGVVLGAVFSSKIPYIGDKAIKKLENENKDLRNNIKKRNENILNLKEEQKKLKSENNDLEKTLVERDSRIKNFKAELDSINIIISQQDSVMIKIYEEKYKDISNVPNMDIDERVKFFSEYFSTRRREGIKR